MKLYSPKDIIGSDLCIGCGVCVALSNRKDTHMRFNRYGEWKPYGPSDWKKKPSEAFSAICPFSPVAINEDELSARLFPIQYSRKASIGSYESNWVGYVKEENFRKNGSSGGLVSWVATELLRKGMVNGVLHVIATDNPQAEGKFFKYHISRTENDIRDGAKSRYYPVEMSEVLRTIKEVSGRYAIIGIPCMIKAIQLLRENDPVFRKRISFTLGLFCGHLKSARFIESLAWQMKVRSIEIKQVDYRYKIPNRPANWYSASLKLINGLEVKKDWWHLKDGDWGAGFFMNTACNYCDDVVAETADISFGDAWIEPYTTDGKGNNVVVVRSKIVKNVISEGTKKGVLELKEVSAEFIEQTQAAGLRQRREGLAYRLTWGKTKIELSKRVHPENNLSPKRKLTYWMRYYISKYSHRIFWLARLIRFPFLYLIWARIINAVYFGIAYRGGKITEMKKRFFQM